jgi:hypothetical protein
MNVNATYILHQVSFYVANNMVKKIGSVSRTFYCISGEFSVHFVETKLLV